MTTRAHPRLAKPLVAESVLEMRFPALKPYGIAPGQLFDRIGSTFSEVEELPAAHIPAGFFPAGIPMPPLARHRLKTADGHRLVQAGLGLLSVNHVKYTSYDDFRLDIKLVLDAAFDLRLLTHIDRLGLRYINKAPLDRPWTEIVTFRVDAPENIERAAQARRFTWRSTLPAELGDLQTVVAWPLQPADGDTASMVLDFDCFLERRVRKSPQDVLQWVDDAHEQVYQVFRSSLTESYFSSLGEVLNASHR